MTVDSVWLSSLRAACSTRSQRAVARTVGYSATAINQVLNGRYPGDLTSIQRAVENTLMSASVECPVQGEIPRSACLASQTSTSRANPTRLALSRNCPTCPNRSTSCAA